MLKRILERIKGKRVLILGFGREGKSSYRFIRTHFPKMPLAVADANNAVFDTVKDENLVSFSGENYLNDLPYFDLIIRTPGIPIRKIAFDFGALTSQTDLFLSAFHKQTIGVSGTKGKSTTASLIHHLLKNSGQKSLLTGNIGIPCFDSINEIADDTTIVFELSAHQLEDTHHSPHISVLLNVFEEHLDHFGNFEAYRQAKFNLIRFAETDDFCIVHQSLKALIPKQNGKLIWIPQTKKTFFLDENISLKGFHNQLNIEFALATVKANGVDETEAVKHLKTFSSLEHRMEFVGTFGNIHFYNDSIATIPEATIAAIETFEKVDFLILGGYDRGIHYESLAYYLVEKNIPHIFVTGKAGDRIATLLKSSDYLGSIHHFDMLQEVFQIVLKHKKPNGICLLSPAASSYDRYKNFEQRGQIFKELAKKFDQ
ncbi:MAG: UDP-N-acetylmuramoyl-L-alanine--D-glutamate ligase [Lentimicrobiaceae bacterium]|jgi:UDP-N-acetylmuramoylalanine--D-glutamate ligase|nr:UDP-N-acetylmuramoyl-L-alanine--D-glutamate ligase [Lentimicrobiaceae bacterium]